MDIGVVEFFGSIVIEFGVVFNFLGIKLELEEGENECCLLKKVKFEKMEFFVFILVVLLIYFLVLVVNNDILFFCE